MSTRRRDHRKRRRSTAFGRDVVLEDVAAEPVVEQPDVPVNGGHDLKATINGELETIGMDATGEHDADTSPERTAKEQAVWETFREEHYEVLEQLPLSLHRAYTLIKELDEQVDAGNTKVLEQVRKYIDMRRAMAGRSPGRTPVPMDVDPAEQPPAETLPPSPSKRTRSKAGPNGMSSPTSPSRAGRHGVQSTSPLSPVPPLETNRTVITSLARTSEAVMRAANEKLNVARFACDLIDRYIRDIDREIKEQETSLSLGLRPGTHPATIVLPDVILPKTGRSNRVQDSPISGERSSPPPVDEVEEQPAAEVIPTDEVVAVAEGIATATTPLNQKRKRGRSHGWSKKKQDHHRERVKSEGADKEKPGIVVGDENQPAEPGRSSVKLTVTLPPLASLQQIPIAEATVDSAPTVEETFCYCHSVAYGEMVGCDGCNGWFHLEHIEEQTIPEGEWFCRDCAPSKGHGRPRAKHTRRRR